MILEIQPTLSRDEVESQLAFTSFDEFLNSFKFAVMQLADADSYRILARRAFQKMADSGIVYAEVIHSAGICLWRGQDAQAIANALIDEGRKAPLAVRWVFDAVRQLGDQHVMQTARFAAEFAGSEVIGFGVGGQETGCAAALLKPAFDYAGDAGMILLPHAGETSNAENVREALELGASRIGHGIRSIDDPELIAELKRRNIPLDVSITSNVLTGAVASLEAHPVRRLYQAGVPIVLNTDDPSFFGTSMDMEFDKARTLGFNDVELEDLRVNGFRYAAAAAPHP